MTNRDEEPKGEKELTLTPTKWTEVGKEVNEDGKECQCNDVVTSEGGRSLPNFNFTSTAKNFNLTLSVTAFLINDHVCTGVRPARCWTARVKVFVTSSLGLVTWSIGMLREGETRPNQSNLL